MLLPVVRLGVVVSLVAQALAQSPITFRYFYDDLNQLVKVVDSTGVSIQYVYDPVGNILQINRSTVAPGALTIFNVIPQTVGTGGTITFQGQGFSTTPSLNTVTIDGIAATVVSATSTTLVVLVPSNGMTGLISVTVGNTTTTFGSNETIIPVPIISSVAPHAMQAGTPVSVFVTGKNLADCAFSFAPSGLALSASSPMINPNGTAATLSVTAGSNVNGRFALVATSSAGANSGLAVTAANSFGVFSDPNADADNDGLANGYELLLGTDPFNPDTDGDGFSDGVEVATGSDPLNPACTPLNCRLSGTVLSLTVSTINLKLPASSFSEADSIVFSSLNTALPSTQMHEAESIVFSVEDSATGGQQISKSKPPATLEPAGATSSLTNPLDSDGDGLSDEDERRLGTDPFNPDTDGDGYPDGLEVALGSDPLDARSVPDIRPPAVLIVPLIDVGNLAIFGPQAGSPTEPAQGDQHVVQALLARKSQRAALARFLALFH
jgi:YD repeat-containing protein